MSTVTIVPGDIIEKDPSDAKVYLFDWDTNNLAAAVTITSSQFSITALYPSASDAALTQDSASILAGNRKTQVRLLGGTVGQTYQVANRIVTNETPPQTKERSFKVAIKNL